MKGIRRASTYYSSRTYQSMSQHRLLLHVSVIIQAQNRCQSSPQAVRHLLDGSPRHAVHENMCVSTDSLRLVLVLGKEANLVGDRAASEIHDAQAKRDGFREGEGRKEGAL